MAQNVVRRKLGDKRSITAQNGKPSDLVNGPHTLCKCGRPCHGQMPSGRVA